jgi:hypothetical protein
VVLFEDLWFCAEFIDSGLAKTAIWDIWYPCAEMSTFLQTASVRREGAREGPLGVWDFWELWCSAET